MLILSSCKPIKQCCEINFSNTVALDKLSELKFKDRRIEIKFYKYSISKKPVLISINSFVVDGRSDFNQFIEIPKLSRTLVEVDLILDGKVIDSNKQILKWDRKTKLKISFDFNKIVIDLYE